MKRDTGDPTGYTGDRFRQMLTAGPILHRLLFQSADVLDVFLGDRIGMGGCWAGHCEFSWPSGIGNLKKKSDERYVGGYSVALSLIKGRLLRGDEGEV